MKILCLLVLGFTAVVRAANVGAPVIETVHQYNSYDGNSTFFNKTGETVQGYQHLGGAFQVITMDLPKFLSLNPRCAPLIVQQCTQNGTGAFYLSPKVNCVSPGDTPAGPPLGYACSNSVPDTAPLYLIGRTFATPGGVVMNHYAASWVAQVPGWTLQYRIGFVPR